MTTDLVPPATDPATRVAARPTVPILVVVAAGIVCALGAPWYSATPAAAAAAAVTLERVVRHRRRGLLDAVLVAAGGLLTALIVTSLVLDQLRTGLTRTSWSVSLAAEAVAALLICAQLRPPAPPLLRAIRIPAAKLTVLGIAGAAVLLATAVLLAQGWSKGEERADLQLSVTGSAPHYQLVVTTADTQGPFQLLVRDPRGERSLGTPFTLDAGSSYRAAITVRPGVRTTVAITHPGQPAAIRLVVINPPAPSASSTRK